MTDLLQVGTENKVVPGEHNVVLLGLDFGFDQGMMPLYILWG